MFNQGDLELKDFNQFTGCQIDSLKVIANSQRKMQFLRVLSDSQQFIKWLQKETKGEYERIHVYLLKIYNLAISLLFLD